mmetsp:Transcript_67937/g.214862  ORF Transcript_67937/g.214862 Transcript_67937/m.214862 type:complete len:351 (-) Transcript_67937:1-1053(-)
MLDSIVQPSATHSSSARKLDSCSMDGPVIPSHPTIRRCVRLRKRTPSSVTLGQPEMSRRERTGHAAAISRRVSSPTLVQPERSSRASSPLEMAADLTAESASFKQPDMSRAARFGHASTTVAAAVRRSERLVSASQRTRRRVTRQPVTAASLTWGCARVTSCGPVLPSTASDTVRCSSMGHSLASAAKTASQRKRFPSTSLSSPCSGASASRNRSPARGTPQRERVVTPGYLRHIVTTCSSEMVRPSKLSSFQKSGRTLTARHCRETMATRQRSTIGRKEKQILRMSSLKSSKSAAGAPPSGTISISISRCSLGGAGRATSSSSSGCSWARPRLAPSVPPEGPVIVLVSL